ncbi:MAG: aminotransferase class I/II-fold pyridoxal phosphate-dependent enzyme, partial [Gammaproteobacteria bacterium]|nr:aminotransferase class I/II-fold pyridoxal phosphate-dependent enzyme [Gammaproteobacteria bacterium]
TRGSDDGIDALCRTFCRAGADGVIVTPPTFGMYAVSARIQGADVREIPLREDFSYPVDEVAAAIDDGTRMVFACSPNNPTGNTVPLDDIRRLCEAASGRALVIVDEAYGEFMAQESAATLIPEFENLAVLRTASKGMALAGARLGFLLGSATLVDLVQRVLPPYPLPTPTLQAARRTYSDGALDIAARRAKELMARRDELSAVLAGNPAVKKVWPSDANYLLVEFSDAAAVSKVLREKGILVRAFDTPRLANSLRISVGSAAENRALLEALAKIDGQVSGE